MSRKLEVCVDNLESAINAFEACVDRIELCSSLTAEGGLTPSVGLLKMVKKLNSNNVPIFCLIRCRAGDFCYTDHEMEIMLEDAEKLKQYGADGFVFGVLTPSLTVDLHKSRDLIKTVWPLPVTFHRAFDLTANPFLSLEYVKDIGYKRILTSGQKPTALEGIELIKKLVEKAKNRIIIIPGSGINDQNLSTILSEVPELREIHASCKISGNKSTVNDVNVDSNDKSSIQDKGKDDTSKQPNTDADENTETSNDSISKAKAKKSSEKIDVAEKSPNAKQPSNEEVPPTNNTKETSNNVNNNIKTSTDKTIPVITIDLDSDENPNSKDNPDAKNKEETVGASINDVVDKPDKEAKNSNEKIPDKTLETNDDKNSEPNVLSNGKTKSDINAVIPEQNNSSTTTTSEKTETGKRCDRVLSNVINKHKRLSDKFVDTVTVEEKLKIFNFGIHSVTSREQIERVLNVLNSSI